MQRQRILKDLEYDEITIQDKSLRSVWNEDLKAFAQDAINKFKSFSRYLEPLATNLDQIFSKKRNGLAHRIVYQNLYTFIRNKKALDDLKIRVKEFGQEREFVATDFSECLFQSGIDKYNTYIGQLVQRLKEYSDSHPKSSMWYKRFKQLNKQILSPRIAPSWLPAAFTNDEMMVVAIRAFMNEVNPHLPALKEIINQIDTYEDHIFIYRKSLHYIAARMMGNYMSLDDAFDIPGNLENSLNFNLPILFSNNKSKLISITYNSSLVILG